MRITRWPSHITTPRSTAETSNTTSADATVSVAVQRRTGGSTRDRPGRLVQVEPIWTTATRAANAVRVRALPGFKSPSLRSSPAPSSSTPGRGRTHDGGQRSQIGLQLASSVPLAAARRCLTCSRAGDRLAMLAGAGSARKGDGEKQPVCPRSASCGTRRDLTTHPAPLTPWSRLVPGSSPARPTHDHCQRAVAASVRPPRPVPDRRRTLASFFRFA
jgi:hypothetical protein